MEYYKIIKDGEIIGIATSEALFRSRARGGTMTATAKTAEFIMCGETAYHADWMQSLSSAISVESADVYIIDEETYQEYLEAIEAGEEILIYTVEEETTDETDEVAETSENTESTEDTPTSYTMPTMEDLVKIVYQLAKRVESLEE